MTRALHTCLTCEPMTSRFGRRGFTRHRDRVCAACRREGRRPAPGRLSVTIDVDTTRFVEAMNRAAGAWGRMGKALDDTRRAARRLAEAVPVDTGELR